MKQIAKGFLSILLVLLVVALGFVVYGNYSAPRQLEEEERRANETPAPVTATPSQEPEDTELEENNADISLAVFGDLVCHSGLNAEALQSDGTYDYTKIFGSAGTLATAADYSIVTLETTFPNTTNYTGYPQFQSPKGLARSLKNAGFDLVNTANNHSMDSYKSGLDRTLDVLDEYGLDHIGTYRTQEERDANNGVLVKSLNGISIAFVSYTYGTNGIPVTGFEYAVNIFNNDYMTTLSDVNYDMLKEDMAYARSLDTDLIIALMHWGTEYDRAANRYQEELADFMFAEGADIILGGHVHVPQPMELRHVTDNEGNAKTGYIVYCLGNFISCQNDPYTNLTAALQLDIRKDLNTGETFLNHVSYKPLFMVDLLDYGVTDAGWQYRLWDLHYAIGSYENGTNTGENLGVINERIYNAMVDDLERLYTIFDPAFDEVNGGVDVRAWAEENPPYQLT